MQSPIRLLYMECRNKKINPAFMNMEIGAGCGDFGQQFFPDCIVTDIRKPSQRECSILCIFNAEEMPYHWTDNRFNNIIMCNPYYYGFDDPNYFSQDFLNELFRIVSNNGNIIIFGNDSNPYCNTPNISDSVRIFNINSIRILHSIADYRPEDYNDHNFYKSIGGETYVTKIHTLQVQK
jgi:hypothetical protein